MSNNNDNKQILQDLYKRYGRKHYTRALKKSPELLKELKQKWGDLSLPELFYLGIYDDKPYCQRGNKRKFKNIEEGYRQFCGVGKECPCRQESHSKRIKNVWENRTEEEKEKLWENYKNTNKLKYGYENPYHNQEVKRKAQKTVQEKYGVDSPLQSNEIQNKIKQTNKKKYGVDYPFQSKDIQNKSYQSIIENNPGIKDVMELARKGAYKKFGGNPSKDEHVKKKRQDSMEKNWGVKHPSQSPELIQKRSEKFFKRHGRYNPSQLRYSNEIWNILNSEEKFKEILDNKGIIGASEYLGVSDGLIGKTIDKFGLKRRGKRSSYEECLTNFFQSLELNFKSNDKSLIKYGNQPYEIDWYFPEHNLAIEFCGLFYHSQIAGNKSFKYHRWKHDECRKQNIKLFTIFEDEFLDKPDIVYSILRTKFGMNEFGEYARNLNIFKVESKKAREFLNNYHLQGEGAFSSYRFGAYDKNNNLRALMTFARNKNLIELHRFVTDGKRYPGVASKLLKNFIRTYNPGYIYTYADLRWSDGNLYNNIGFTFKHETGPSYWYLPDYRKREHRSNFTKQKIKTKFGLDKNEEFTEWNFLSSMGYDRIWDCGNQKWVLDLS